MERQIVLERGAEAAHLAPDPGRPAPSHGGTVAVIGLFTWRRTS